MSGKHQQSKSITGAALEAVVVGEMATIADATAAFERGKLGIAVVCDSAGAPKGYIDDAALRRAALRGLPASDAVTKIMAFDFQLLDSGEPTASVAFTPARGKLASARVAAPAPAADFALVLAGGLGSRMAPLTESTPKPLVPLAGKPMIEHVLRHLAKCKIVNVAIATNYRAQQVEEFVGCGARYGLRVTFLREEKRLGTAGALSLLDPIPAAPFFVVNADVLTTLDLAAMSRQHHKSDPALTMAVAPHVVECPYGVARLADSRVVDLAEKPKMHNWVNAGIYVVSPRVASAVPRNSYIDMTTMIDRMIHAGEVVEAFPIREYWRDAGTPEDLARAEEELRSA